jgi:hypothetical protein
MSKNKSNGVPAAPAADRATSKPGAEAAYFLSLKMQDVRCFGEEQTIDFSDGEGCPARWTIILGANGTGKTTLLQMLVFPEKMQVQTNEPVPRITFPIPRSAALTLRGLDPVFQRNGREEVEIKITLGCGPPMASPTRRYEPHASDVSIRYTPAGAATTTSGPYDIAFPVCYAYGAGRRMGQGTLAEPTQDDPAATLFSDYWELRNAEEWLLQTDYAASKPSEFQAAQRQRLEQVKELLLRILPEGEVDDIRFVVSGGAWAKARVEFKTPYGWVPLRQLGYGYRTLIAWMVDFASRMVERYPDSPDPLAEPAVVLVDEIDLHLHPKWQRQLIGYLTERFPNTQFIATAHSPLIVQAANEVGANLAVLRREGDHVVIENDPPALRGWSVNQLLTSELYDLPSPYPPQYDELFAQREALLSKEKLSKADLKRLKRLDEQMAELPLGDTAQRAKASMLIQDTLNMLKERVDQDS